MEQTTFADLGVADDLVAILAERGITQPFPIQALTIPDALAGRDVCGKAKTGSGKTLAFGLPVLERVGRAKPGRPTAMCLVPTRELAVQVTDELKPLGDERGVRVTAIYGGARIDRQISELRDGVDFVIATPGRVIDLIERKEINVADLQIVVLDEADRMADMGFMPQVEWILRNVDKEHQTLLFSATLDGAVDGLVKRYQHDPAHHEVATDRPTVEGMEHRFLKVHEMDKVKVASTIVKSHGRTIIFSATKHGCDRLALKLEKEGVAVAAIHGDLRQNFRERALSDFQAGKLEALVATDVAARGIHVDDVAVVIHFDIPPDHKTYLHRSGRTARAGETGIAVTLLDWNQEFPARQLQRRLGLSQPLVEVFSNDPRLADLTAWDPAGQVA